MDARGWRRLHLGATAAWAIAAVPTVLVWPTSVLWVGLASCYANAVGHFSAYQAARAEGNERWQVFHAVMTVAWFLACVPTVVWWHASVLWVALISCYANAVGHASAWQATGAEMSSGEKRGNR